MNLPWHHPQPDPAETAPKPARDQDVPDLPDDKILSPDTPYFGGAPHCGIGWSTRR